MSLYNTQLKPFFEHHLIEELYCIKNKFMICTLANWKFIAILINPNTIEELGGYAGIIVDENDIDKILNISKQPTPPTENYKKSFEEFYFNDKTLKELIEVKAKIDCGELQPLYRKSFVKELKKKYIEQKQEVVDKYGNPPAFSKKKMKNLLISIVFFGYGAPFFYLGKTFWGILCIFMSLLMCMTLTGGMTLLLPIFIWYGWGVILFPIKILLGKVKDRNGLYVTSVKMQENIRHICATIDRYKEEIEEDTIS